MATRAAWTAMVARSAPVPVKVGSVQPTGATVPAASGAAGGNGQGVVVAVVEQAPPAAGAGPGSKTATTPP